MLETGRDGETSETEFTEETRRAYELNVGRFKIEYQTILQLDHPGITKVHKIGFHDGHFYPNPPSMSHRQRDYVPDYLDKIVMRLIAYEPKNRYYGNARAVINALTTGMPDAFRGDADPMADDPLTLMISSLSQELTDNAKPILVFKDIII
jgi:hypothetical protein